MKDAEFARLWREQIYPALQELADERRKAQWRYFYIFSGAVGFIIILLTLEVSGPWWVALVGLVIMVISFRLGLKTGNDFVANFKWHVVDTLNNIAVFSWSIKTDLANYRGAELLKESRLYHGYDNVSEDDKLYATFRSATIDVCEITAHMELRNEPVRTIFQGFIGRISVDTPFLGETYVQTESDGAIIDSGAGGFFDADEDIVETELEWGEFERFLVVKSSDPTEARRIFTPDFMAVLYDWWRTHDEPLRISFRDQAMYIGFPTDVDLEPSLLGGIKNERSVVRDILGFMLMLEELTKLLVEKQRLRYDNTSRS